MPADVPAATQCCCLVTRGLAEEIFMAVPEVASPAPHCLPAQESPSSALAVGWRVSPHAQLVESFLWESPG